MGNEQVQNNFRNNSGGGLNLYRFPGCREFKMCSTKGPKVSFERKETIFHIIVEFGSFEIAQEKVSLLQNYLRDFSGEGFVFGDNNGKVYYPDGLKGKIVLMEVLNGYSILTIRIQTPLSCTNEYGDTYCKERIPVNAVKYLDFMNSQDYVEQISKYADYCDEFLQKLSFEWTVSYSGRKYFYEIDKKVNDFKVISFPHYDDLKSRNFHKFKYFEEEDDRIIFSCQVGSREESVEDQEDNFEKSMKSKRKEDKNKKKKKKFWVEEVLCHIFVKKKPPKIIHYTYLPQNELNFRDMYKTKI